MTIPSVDRPGTQYGRQASKGAVGCRSGDRNTRSITIHYTDRRSTSDICRRPYDAVLSYSGQSDIGRSVPDQRFLTSTD